MECDSEPSAQARTRKHRQRSLPLTQSARPHSAVSRLAFLDRHTTLSILTSRKLPTSSSGSSSSSASCSGLILPSLHFPFAELNLYRLPPWKLSFPFNEAQREPWELQLWPPYSLGDLGSHLIESWEEDDKKRNRQWIDFKKVIEIRTCRSCLASSARCLSIS